MRKIHGIILKKKSRAFFNILTEPLLAQKKNDTSTESSDTKLFADGKSKDVALSGGLDAHLQQKDIEKKVTMDQSKDEKKKKIIGPISFIYQDIKSKVYAHLF